MKSEINKNYLWDKSESDAEIERLENLLQGFAMQEFEAPILPQKTFDFQPKQSKLRFYFPFAFAASLLLAVLLGVWFLNTGKPNSSNEVTFNKSNEIPQNKVSQPTLPVENFDKPVEKVVKPSEKIIVQKTNFVKEIAKETKPSEKEVYQIEKAVFMPKKRVEPMKKVENNKSEIVLTDEEIKAYETLKLALSITSNKLKIVKEKIDNTEQNSAENNKKADTK